MKVYVLMVHHHYDDAEIVAVYAEKDAADAALSELENGAGYSYYVEGWDVQ